MRHQIRMVRLGEFSLAIVVCLVICVYFPSRPPTPPSRSASIPKFNVAHGVRQLFKWAALTHTFISAISSIVLIPSFARIQVLLSSFYTLYHCSSRCNSMYERMCVQLILKLFRTTTSFYVSGSSTSTSGSCVLRRRSLRERTACGLVCWTLRWNLPFPRSVYRTVLCVPSLFWAKFRFDFMR